MKRCQGAGESDDESGAVGPRETNVLELRGRVIPEPLDELEHSFDLVQ